MCEETLSKIVLTLSSPPFRAAQRGVFRCDLVGLHHQESLQSEVQLRTASGAERL